MTNNLSSKFLKVFLILTSLIVATTILSACGNDKPTEKPTLTLPPTWTPTPTVSATDTPKPTATPTSTPASTNTPVPPTEAPTDTPAPTATPKPKPVAKAIVTAPQANLRKGPGTTHPKAGVAKKGDALVIIGKNKAGDWWQVQFNGKPAWIYKNLVRAENAGGIKVAAAIPTPPPAPTAKPVPPTNTPQPVASNPCAKSGGGGCLWHLRSGPAFAPNVYGLKLTFGFVHGGRGDEAQGSYFVWLEKNGVKLPIPDSVRSWTGAKRSGPNGEYNYEYTVGLSDLPDKKIEGCYTGWVLNGYAEQDSPQFQFCVPDGQGEVWMLFDQN